MKLPTKIQTIEEAQQIATLIIEHCQSSTLLREYAQYLQSQPVVLNTAGWHARGEQLFTTVTLARRALGHHAQEIQVLNATGRTECVVAHLAAVCALATPYLWSDRIVKLVLASPDLPAHIISPTILPFPYMYWSFETAYPIALGPDGGGEVNWMLVYRHQADQFLVAFDLTIRGSGHRTICGVPFQAGRFPDDYPDLYQNAVVVWILKMLAFLASPYIETTPELAPRPLRRRLIKAADPLEAAQMVSVIRLRKRADHVQATQEGETSEHTWHHQWWVTGHFRAQWYASEKAHRVVWIAPYLKGPSDKPVLDKVYAVQR